MNQGAVDSCYHDLSQRSANQEEIMDHTNEKIDSKLREKEAGKMFLSTEPYNS